MSKYILIEDGQNLTSTDKPAKYGIKIWWTPDSKRAYPLEGIIYTGKHGGVREVNQEERVVK